MTSACDAIVQEAIGLCTDACCGSWGDWCVRILGYWRYIVTLETVFLLFLTGKSNKFKKDQCFTWTPSEPLLKRFLIYVNVLSRTQREIMYLLP